MLTRYTLPAMILALAAGGAFAGDDMSGHEGMDHDSKGAMSPGNEESDTAGDSFHKGAGLQSGDDIGSDMADDPARDDDDLGDDDTADNPAAADMMDDEAAIAGNDMSGHDGMDHDMEGMDHDAKGAMSPGTGESDTAGDSFHKGPGLQSGDDIGSDMADDPARDDDDLEDDDTADNPASE